MISQKSEVLKEFFMKELVELIDKYNKLDEELVRKVERVFECLKTDNEEQELLNKFEEVVQLAEGLDEEVEQDLIKFYFYVKSNIREITIEEAKLFRYN